MSEIKDTQHPKVEITVENFGPIAEANIDLRPLTIFVGPSNTGKTYFATLVYALHSIFVGSTHTPEPIKKNISHKLSSHHDAVELAFKRYFDVASISDLGRFGGSNSDSLEVLLNLSDMDREGWCFRLRSGDGKVTLNEKRKGISTRHPNPERNSEKCHYLPATRGGLLQSYRIVAGSLMDLTLRSDNAPSEIPTLSAVTVDFMRHLTFYEENGKPGPDIQGIADALESEVLTGKIVVTASQGGYPKYNYCPDGSDQEVSLTRAAAIVSELAPLVLFLRSLVCPGDTLIIEEPEAHLHPGAQADMAVIFARLVRAGVRVIITTHSDWLLQEIGNLIRVGELENAGKKVSELPTSLQKEQVGVWHFQKNGRVAEIPYDRINGVEPMEYLDVAEDLYNRSARLQNRLEETKGEGERESS